MSRKEKGYLTIGEIYGITGIHPKSIRYYERIGILSPAQVDPENGYRYFSPLQVHHLFAIKSCVRFGIPLKDFPKYYQDGSLYTSLYLEDAAALVLKNIRDLQNKLDRIEYLRDHIRLADKLMAEKKILEQPQPKRTFLVQEISRDLDVKKLFQVYTSLYAKAHQQGLGADLLCGRLGLFSQEQLQKLYAGVLITSPETRSDTLTMPQAPCKLLYSQTPDLLQAPRIFPAPADAGQKMLVLESNCIASAYETDSPGYILRCIHI